MRCSVCKAELRQAFLGKLHGTYVRLGGKIFAICPACQRLPKKQLLSSLQAA